MEEDRIRVLCRTPGWCVYKIGQGCYNSRLVCGGEDRGARTSGRCVEDRIGVLQLQAGVWRIG